MLKQEPSYPSPNFKEPGSFSIPVKRRLNIITPVEDALLSTPDNVSVVVKLIVHNFSRACFWDRLDSRLIDIKINLLMVQPSIISPKNLPIKDFYYIFSIK